MKLKWPWNEFPKNQESWDVCKQQMESALLDLQSCLLLGTFTNVTGFKEGVIEFWEKIAEPYECKETIDIEEFKKLLTRAASDVTRLYGNYAISEEAHRKQCKNLKVGDTVFFIRTEPDLSHPDVRIDVVITQAKVIEHPLEKG